jgi:hypothetical protein
MAGTPVGAMGALGVVDADGVVAGSGGKLEDGGVIAGSGGTLGLAGSLALAGETFGGPSVGIAGKSAGGTAAKLGPDFEEPA